MSFAPIIHLENELVRRIALGDKKAFETLYYMYYKRLCQFAYLFLRSKELSEEVVSDVKLNIWIKREQLDPERNVRSFLYTSVRNHAIDCLRTKTIHVQENINVYELDIESSEPSVEEIIDRELFRERLQQAFDLLPERCRMIARLHYNDQLTYKEIAEILEIAYDTVKTQIAIATQKIKEVFEKHGWNK